MHCLWWWLLPASIRVDPSGFVAILVARDILKLVVIVKVGVRTRTLIDPADAVGARHRSVMLVRVLVGPRAHGSVVVSWRGAVGGRMRGRGHGGK